MAARAALLAIRGYKILVSPLFAGSCRYWPSCADFTGEAIARHGVLAGIWLGSRRLARCQPFGGSGYDPVPHDHPWKKTPRETPAAAGPPAGPAGGTGVARVV